MQGDLPDLIARRAELTPDSVALEEPGTGRRLTYAALDARAGRAAGLLESSGVGKGDRVAILCRHRFSGHLAPPRDQIGEVARHHRFLNPSDTSAMAMSATSPGLRSSSHRP